MGGFTVPDTAVRETGSGGRGTRAAKAVWRGFSKEGTLVVFFGFVLSMLYNLPLVLHPKSQVADGLGDPLLQAWELAWHRQIFTADDFWTANILHPSVGNFAFTDSLLGYLPLALIGGDDQYGAILRYNVAFITAFALAFVGAYLLARQLGTNWQAAALAGVIFAWAPWRHVHGTHLNILSTGGIALALYAIAKGHGYSFKNGLDLKQAKPGWALAGWLIAAWQITFGFATGIAFVYVMIGVGIALAIAMLKNHRQFSMRLILFNGAGAVVFLIITFVMMIPYLDVIERYGFKRHWVEVEDFSSPVRGLWTAHNDTWLWLETGFNRLDLLPKENLGEMMLFPGLTVTVFAVLGLFVSAWPRKIRIALGTSAFLVTGLALGTTFFGGFLYRLMWDYVPGWDAIRTPGRLILWVLLLLILLAVGAVTRLGELMVERTQVSLHLIAIFLVFPMVAALVEGIPTRPYETPPGIPPDLREAFTREQGPMLILPVDNKTNSEFRYMLWSTHGFPKMVNGATGISFPKYEEIIVETRSFPSSRAVDVLHKYGIKTVIILKADAVTSEYRFAVNHPIAGLPLKKTEYNDIIVFTVEDAE